MCKAQDKLVIFSYIFKKFAEHQQAIMIFENPNVTKEEVLDTFSNTRIMKLLYCLCLESLHNPQDSNTINKNNLFTHLGAFTALPHGPVLLEVYSALDIVPGFEYKDGKFIGWDSDSIINSISRIGEEIMQLIDDAMQRLVEHMTVALFTRRDYLIELTHKLPCWRQAFIYNSHQKMIIEDSFLFAEYNQYKDEVGQYK